jgi:hypothetical protein
VTDLRLLLALVLLAGCARTVELEIHHPATCCPEGDPSCDPECPLAGIEAFRTRLVRLGGTQQLMGCEAVAPEPMCDWEELSSFVFLDTVFRGGRASDSIEVRIDGLDDPTCADGSNLVLACDSLGDTAVNLETDETVRIWCDCPF